MRKRAYLHSPFSETTVNKDNRFLLLQFILKELFLSFTLCQKGDNEPLLNLQTFSSLSLSSLTKSAPLDRIQEHTTLIPFAFPFKEKESEILTHSLSNTITLLYNLSKCSTPPSTVSSQITNYLRQMFFLLEPFVEECKNEGSFLFFLLSNHKDISLLSHPKYLPSLLNKFHPQGLPFLQEYLCDHFYKKGFSYLIPKIKFLVKQIKKSEIS